MSISDKTPIDAIEKNYRIFHYIWEKHTIFAAQLKKKRHRWTQIQENY
jgi:hypothetical protein